jgi:hypothetical protein
MYELACPACNSPSQYDFNDYLLMCPFCSCTFRLDAESGQKEIFNDHYIVGNTSSPAKVKELVLEWLKRLNHKPGATDKEFFVVNISGLSIPFWVVSMEVHTAWKGLIKRHNRARLDQYPGSDYLVESGQFKRNYRWAITGRHNLCESWGMTRLHEPKEKIQVDWDGFPLDSTFSRGQIQDQVNERGAYDAREFFEFKFANGLPLVGVQVDEEEALRRAKMHVEQYHLHLAKLNVDYLTDYRTEVEVAGIQLIHLPFWYATYVYRPRTMLRYFFQPKEKNVVLDGYNNGILVGEIAIQHKDKLWVNAVVCGVAAMFLAALGVVWHPAFLAVALFTGVVAAASGYIASARAKEADTLSVIESGNSPVGGKAATSAA